MKSLQISSIEAFKFLISIHIIHQKEVLLPRIGGLLSRLGRTGRRAGVTNQNQPAGELIAIFPLCWELNGFLLQGSDFWWQGIHAESKGKECVPILTIQRFLRCLQFQILELQYWAPVCLFSFSFLVLCSADARGRMRQH